MSDEEREPWILDSTEVRTALLSDYLEIIIDEIQFCKTIGCGNFATKTGPCLACDGCAKPGVHYDRMCAEQIRKLEKLGITGRVVLVSRLAYVVKLARKEQSGKKD